MKATVQTSIRVPPLALSTLEQVRDSLGLSRDAAIRRLLAEHVAAQLAVPEDQRLTHVSTVLRYPPREPGRFGTDGRVRLSIRLDEGAAETAKSVSLKFPGQAQQRGHRDYVARPLSDAVITAIARAQPFIDPGLNGLPPLWTHSAALGLWRLTVAATLTPAEERVLLGRPAEEAIVLREETVAWHSPWRFEVALHLAKRMLLGEERGRYMNMLTNQAADFRRLQFDFERTEDFSDHHLLHGAPSPRLDHNGRGGTVVWRAEREVALTNVGRWLVGRAGAARSFAVSPPGWALEMPAEWHAVQVPHGSAAPTQLQVHIEAGRILRLDVGSRSVIWPLESSGDVVPGFGSVLAAATDISPLAVVEAVLASPIRADLGPLPRIHPGTACELGLISAAERDAIVSDAEQATQSQIRSAMTRAAQSRPEITSQELASLRAAMSDPQRFVRLARKLHVGCYLITPAWSWEVESIAEALTSKSHSSTRLAALTRAILKVQKWVLESDMERAWHAAFWLGRTDPYDEM